MKVVVLTNRPTREGTGFAPKGVHMNGVLVCMALLSVFVDVLISKGWGREGGVLITK